MQPSKAEVAPACALPRMWGFIDFHNERDRGEILQEDISVAWAANM